MSLFKDVITLENQISAALAPPDLCQTKKILSVLFCISLWNVETSFPMTDMWQTLQAERYLVHSSQRQLRLATCTALNHSSCLMDVCSNLLVSIFSKLMGVKKHSLP